MQVKNMKYTASGMIEMEIYHPNYGWIPFSASPNDSELLGRELYAQAIAGTLGAIAPYIQSLADAQTKRLAAMEAAYTIALAAPIAYLGTTFQADPESLALLAQTLTALGGATPSGLGWYDVNNVKLAMTNAQLQGLGQTIFARGQPLFENKQAKKAAIRAALTVADINAVIF
jgi:hypothetical protein